MFHLSSLRTYFFNVSKHRMPFTTQSTFLSKTFEHGYCDEEIRVFDQMFCSWNQGIHVNNKVDIKK